jgi:hypothetical protein
MGEYYRQFAFVSSVLVICDDVEALSAWVGGLEVAQLHVVQPSTNH